MPFDRTQPYAIASGGGGEWYLQDGQAYSLNGVAIDAPDIPATRNQAVGPFCGLSDVPNSYKGAGGKLLKVKSSADGVEFVSPAADAGAVVFTELTDAPDSYTGAGGKLVKVNAGATALEFVSPAADAGAVEFTELTDVPSAYTAQGGKLVAVKNDVSGLEFVDAPITERAAGAPASATASGTLGEYFADADFAYFCIGANAWMRIAADATVW